MTERSYLLDENIPTGLAGQLRRRNPAITVQVIGDDKAPPKGTSDAELLLWLEQNGFSLITLNRKTMPSHLRQHLATGHHVPGVFILKSGALMRAVLDDLLLIWEASTPDEYQDQIIYIPV